MKRENSRRMDSDMRDLGCFPGCQATLDPLRKPDGALDPNKLAALFGVSIEQLATVAGTSSVALTDAPDCTKWPVIAAMKRCVYLMVLNPDPANFRRWLGNKQSELGDATPLSFVLAGRPDVVADMVEDYLTARGG